jgi:hypothetical protein
MINIILASGPAFPAAPEVVALLEAQADFRIVARPQFVDQLVLDRQVASVLVVAAGFYQFAALAVMVARSNFPMAVLTDMKRTTC